MTESTWLAVTAEARTRVRAILEKHSNKLSEAQDAALHGLIASMVGRLSGSESGRIAFGLPTGAGKTSSIIALCAALETHPECHGKTIAVSASRVEALCTLKRDLIEAGVSKDRIGLLHAKKYDKRTAEKITAGVLVNEDYASEPSEGDDRPIILVTHNRIRGKQGQIADYMRRDLVIWDESLFISDSSGVPVRMLDESAAALERRSHYHPEYTDLADYLANCLERALIAKEELEGKPDSEVVFSFPSLSAEYQESFRSLLKRDFDAVKRMLDYVSEPIRYLPTRIGGVLSYRLAVPDDLDNIVVLDASFPIRELVRSTTGILDGEQHPVLAEAGVKLATLKSYEGVTLRWMQRAGGRCAMERDLFKTRRSEQSAVCRDVMEVVKAVPEDEAIMIFTFKKRQGDKRSMADVLLDYLDREGIDLSATVKDHEGKDRPRITVQTWGQETSSNSFSYCRHVVLAGVMMRSEEDVAAALVGERRRIDEPIPGDRLRRLVQTEAAHCAYQALSRGSCRTTANGQAGRMTAYVMHYDPALIDNLRKVMPGVTVQTWGSVDAKVRTGKYHTIATAIADYLGNLPPTVQSVSLRSVKKALGLEETDRDAFRKARDAVRQMVPWTLQGHTLVRMFSPE